MSDEFAILIAIVFGLLFGIYFFLGIAVLIVILIIGLGTICLIYFDELLNAVAYFLITTIGAIIFFTAGLVFLVLISIIVILIVALYLFYFKPEFETKRYNHFCDNCGKEIYRNERLCTPCQN